MNNLIDALYGLGSGLGYLRKAIDDLEGDPRRNELVRSFGVISSEVSALDAVLYPEGD